MSDAASYSDPLNQIRDLLTRAIQEDMPFEQFLMECDELVERCAAGLNQPDFDETVRTAWHSAATSFTTEHLLCGLVMAYGSAIKGEEE